MNFLVSGHRFTPQSPDGEVNVAFLVADWGSSGGRLRGHRSRGSTEGSSCL